MFYSNKIKCDICKAIILDWEAKVCDECVAAIKAAQEQEEYLLFIDFQKTIQTALSIGISKIELAVVLKCNTSDIERFISGKNKPKSIKIMIKLIDNLIIKNKL